MTSSQEHKSDIRLEQLSVCSYFSFINTLGVIRRFQNTSPGQNSVASVWSMFRLQLLSKRPTSQTNLLKHNSDVSAEIEKTVQCSFKLQQNYQFCTKNPDTALPRTASCGPAGVLGGLRQSTVPPVPPSWTVRVSAGQSWCRSSAAGLQWRVSAGCWRTWPTDDRSSPPPAHRGTAAAGPIGRHCGGTAVWTGDTRCEETDTHTHSLTHKHLRELIPADQSQRDTEEQAASSKYSHPIGSSWTVHTHQLRLHVLIGYDKLSKHQVSHLHTREGRSHTPGHLCPHGITWTCLGLTWTCVCSGSHLDIGPIPLGRSLKCQVGQRRLLTSSKVHLEDISWFDCHDANDGLSFSGDILRTQRQTQLPACTAPTPVLLWGNVLPS